MRADDVWFETRWLCPTCSRFLPESAIGSRNVWDPIDSYYGFREEVWADCGKCGRVDNPRCVPTKSHPLILAGERS